MQSSESEQRYLGGQLSGLRVQDWVQKYWPPVERIDNVYGDRHLICTCAGMEEVGGEPSGGKA